LTAVIFVGGAIWWLMHWRYGGQIESLKQECQLYKARSEEKGQASPPTDLFVVQQVEHKLGVRDDRGGFGWLDPSVKPKTETLVLQVVVSVITIPDKIVEHIELEMMAKRIPSDWESLQVHGESQQYIYFDIPKWANPGRHAVRLIARSHDTERLSTSFDIDIPKA
jgi:hypothetical protein